MADNVTIVRLEDRERWVAEHRQGGLPSQSWDYAWALRAAGVDAKLAVVRSAGARMLLPFVERAWQDHIDIATILGMSGASIDTPSAAPLALWREFATSQGWVSGYIQLAVCTDLGSAAFNEQITTNNISFMLDIQHPDILGSASRTIRRKIQQVANQGAVLVDNRAVLADRLLHLYPLTMRRVNARSHYHVPAETLREWSHDPASLLLGAALEGSIEAVYTFRIADNYAETHINASSDRARHVAPWLIWNGISRLRNRGVKRLDLGGSAQPGDGLYCFKQRFGGIPKAIRAVHQIYNRQLYNELCRNSGVSQAIRWFPAYRAADVEELEDPGHVTMP